MTEPLQVGQFAIVDHDPVERGPNAGIFHGKGPSEDRAELIVLAEGTTPAGEAFAGHVVSALGHLFNSLDMSLTGSLHRLYLAADHNVVDWNHKSIAMHRVSIGLTCFARRANQAVIAQCGPSIAFHFHRGDVLFYTTDEEHARPIGAGPIDVQLRKIDFDPGDRLLLVSSIALRLLDDETMLGIMELPAEQILRELYQRVNEARHLTAVLLSQPVRARERALPPPSAPDTNYVIGGATDEPERDEATDDSSANGNANFQPSLFIDARAPRISLDEARRRLAEQRPRRRNIEPVAMVAEAMPAPLLRAVGDTTLTRLAAERRAHAEAMHDAAASIQAVAHPVLRTPSGAIIEPAPRPERRPRKPRRDSFSRGLVKDDIPPPPLDTVAEAMPRAGDLAAARRAQSLSVVSPASGEVIAGETASSMSRGGSLVRLRPNMSGRWRGGGALSRRGTMFGNLPPTWLIILAGLGILILLVGFLTLPRLISQQSSAHYAQLISNAQQRFSASQVEQDPAARRKDLTDARAMLLEAQGLSNAGPEVQSQLKAVNAAIAVMDAVRHPAAVQTIGSLEQFGSKPVSVARLTVGDQDAYVLDGATPQVIAMPLAGGPPAVIYAADQSKKQGNPIATAFLDSANGGKPALLILDATNALWTYSPGGSVHQVPFAAPSGLHPTDIAVRSGDLYVLDSSQNTIYRFASNDGTFGTAPTVALQTADLAAARRLSVGDDVVTSDANGTLHRFTGNVALTLSEAGIDQRLVAPASPQTFPKDGDIAVLDPSNNRIVGIRRDGTFDYQYQAKDFTASVEFALRNGTGYIFANGQLKKITF